MNNKPRARKMWANYYPTGIICHPLRRKARINAPANCLSAAIPVAVVPLDDVDAMVLVAALEWTKFRMENNPSVRMRAALTAIGVLPRQRKGGAK